MLPQPLLLLAVAPPQALQFTLSAKAALSGLTFTLQAVYPGLPGVLDPSDVMTSNPEQLVIRY